MPEPDDKHIERALELAGLNSSADIIKSWSIHQPIRMCILAHARTLQEHEVQGWAEWNKQRPALGQKIIIVCNDGCSTSIALMTDDGPLEGEIGDKLSDHFLDGSIWHPLPDDYTVAFTEATDADWY